MRTIKHFFLSRPNSYIYRFRVVNFTEQDLTALLYEVFSFLQELSEDLKLHNWYSSKWNKANFWNTVFTGSISRSWWSCAFLYHGHFMIGLKALFWNRWMISMFESLEHPHNWIRYVQTGLRICIYRSSLL